MKLFVGSSGTLAVMTRAFLRLRALPEETRTVARRFRRPLEAEQAWRELRDLPGQPEVAVLLNPAAADAFDLEGWNLLLRFEGLREEVQGAVSGAGGEQVSSPPWDEIRDFPLGGALSPSGARAERVAKREPRGWGPRGTDTDEVEVALVLRGQVAPRRTFHLAESWQDGGPLVAYPDAGLVYSHTRDPDVLADRQERAGAHGGGVVLERAPTELKHDLDVFGEAPGGFELMQKIKQKLDPKGILSPGRFVGRI